MVLNNASYLPYKHYSRVLEATKVLGKAVGSGLRDCRVEALGLKHLGYEILGFGI